MSKEIILDDGKYKFFEDEDGVVCCDRYDQSWREFVGDKAIHRLFTLAVEQQETIKELDRSIEVLVNENEALVDELENLEERLS